MHAWQVYMDEFRRRAEPALGLQVGREDLMTTAAHEAYQAASDRLTREHGWEEEHALVVMRGLNGEVKQWLDQGDTDWQRLGERLRHTEQQLDSGWSS